MKLTPNVLSLVEDLIKQIESGTPMWVRPWRGNPELHPLPRNAWTGQEYHGCNIFFLMLSSAVRGFQSPYWLTFKQKNLLSTKLNTPLMIREGSKASFITKSINGLRKGYAEKDGKFFDANGAPASERAATWATWRTYAVFNAEQIEGMPKEYGIPTPIEFSKTERDDLLDSVFASLDITIMEDPLDSACALYSPAHDKIVMPRADAFYSNEEYEATLLHEIVHATGHKSRLDRPTLYNGGDADEYSKEELVAELGASLLCAHYGLPGKLQHAAYLAHYVKRLRESPAYLFTAAKEAERAYRWVLDKAAATTTTITAAA